MIVILFLIVNLWEKNPRFSSISHNQLVLTFSLSSSSTLSTFFLSSHLLSSLLAFFYFFYFHLSYSFLIFPRVLVLITSIPFSSIISICSLSPPPVFFLLGPVFPIHPVKSCSRSLLFLFLLRIFFPKSIALVSHCLNLDCWLHHSPFQFPLFSLILERFKNPVSLILAWTFFGSLDL